MPDDLSSRPAIATSLRATLQPKTWNPDTRTVDVIWTTGADVKRRDWMTGREFIERLAVTADAIDLTRLNAGAPVLDTHSSYALGDVIGVVENATIVNGEGRATLRLSEREEVAGVVGDIAAGIIRNISVGYIVQTWDTTPPTRTDPEVRTATRWTPYEVSFVPVPADPGAQVRAAVSPDSPPPNAARAASQEPSMTDVMNTAPAQAVAPDIAAIRAEAAQAERQRVSDIRLAARQAGMDEAWTDAQIAAGTTADAARAAALASLQERAAARVPAQAAGNRQDAGETHARLLANALEHRAGAVKDLEDGARQFRGFRMVDFARECIVANGGSVRGLTTIETFKEAMRLSRSAAFTRDHVASDFANLLANTASKSLRQAYGSAPRSFVPWARQVNLPDFKTFKSVSLGGAPALAEITEGGEVTYGTIADGAESWNLVRYGKAVAISYVAMVNDDMSGFTRLPAMFGAAAARLESTTVYGILTANAALSDSVTLFHASHSNSTTGALSADATGVANVGAAATLLRKQTAPNGDILGLQPRFLIVPAALEVKTFQLFAPSIMAATAGAVNPYAGSVTPIVEPRLDATSAVAFYVIADPNDIDTVHYGYLDGEAGPTIESEVEFDTDGMKTKCIHNFGAKAVDYRGMVYSTGA